MSEAIPSNAKLESYEIVFLWNSKKNSLNNSWCQEVIWLITLDVIWLHRGMMHELRHKNFWQFVPNL